MPQFGPIRWRSFRNWLFEPLGQSLLAEESKQVAKLVKHLFGYHLLLVGDAAFSIGIKENMIPHRVWIHPHPISHSELSPLAARQDKLPLLSDEFELVYLAHCLEYLRNPHEALREAYRVLKPEGHVIITVFNPLSLWGIWRLAFHYFKKVPWDGRFITLFRLKDWLALLGFDLIETHYYLFRPPVNNENWLKRSAFMDTLGKWVWPFWGGSYIILAKKRVMTLTPLRTKFKARQRELAPSLAEPAARVKRAVTNQE